MKQKQKVPENENPKTDSNEEKGSNETSYQKDKKKKKSILTWQHSSTKKEKDGGKNLLSEKNDVNPHCYTAKSMMYHGGHNPSNRWPISAAPRGCYPPFSMAPMYGPYGCGGGPIQPYQSMPRATMFDTVHISPYPPMAAASPYPPMAAAAPFPYWQTRPYMDTNPMKRYTSYADNYSYCFI